MQVLFVVVCDCSSVVSTVQQKRENVHIARRSHAASNVNCNHNWTAAKFSMRISLLELFFHHENFKCFCGEYSQMGFSPSTIRVVTLSLPRTSKRFFLGKQIPRTLQRLLRQRMKINWAFIVFANEVFAFLGVLLCNRANVSQISKSYFRRAIEHESEVNNKFSLSVEINFWIIEDSGKNMMAAA